MFHEMFQAQLLQLRHEAVTLDACDEVDPCALLREPSMRGLKSVARAAAVQFLRARDIALQPDGEESPLPGVALVVNDNSRAHYVGNRLEKACDWYAFGLMLEAYISPAPQL